jgi:hypothetical protein
MKDWKTTWSGTGAGAFWALGLLAAAPHDPRAQALYGLLPAKWQPVAVCACAVAGAILHCLNACAQADAKPSTPPAP